MIKSRMTRCGEHVAWMGRKIHIKHGKPEGKRQLVRPKVDGRMMLKRMGRYRVVPSGSELRPVVRSCYHGSEPSHP
jgi:hypothetical protein